MKKFPYNQYIVYIWVKPRATKRTLHLSRFPLALVFIFKTYFELLGFQFGGKGVRIQVLFFSKESSSA